MNEPLVKAPSPFFGSKGAATSSTRMQLESNTRLELATHVQLRLATQLPDFPHALWLRMCS